MAQLTEPDLLDGTSAAIKTFGAYGLYGGEYIVHADFPSLLPTVRR